MSASAPVPAEPPAKKTRDPDRYSGAGLTPDPWDLCAKIEYGGDRSAASAVRAQVIATPPEGRPRIEDRLLKALATPGRTDAGLAFVCQMLALVGTAKSVPALEPLLRNPPTVEPARYALQAIPAAEAGAALRQALPAVSGPAKAGLIGTLAMRGETSAAPALTALQTSTSEPAIVRAAAARAVAHLASLAQPKRDTP